MIIFLLVIPKNTTINFSSIIIIFLHSNHPIIIDNSLNIASSTTISTIIIFKTFTHFVKWNMIINILNVIWYIMLLNLLINLGKVKIRVRFGSLHKKDNRLYDIYCIFILILVDDFIELVGCSCLRTYREKSTFPKLIAGVK